MAVNYDDAINFKRNRRNMEPATYNARRLLEHPIPSLSIENQIEEESDSNESSSENDNAGKLECANSSL